MRAEGREELVRYVQARWGPGALRLGADAPPLVLLPTGIPELDALLGGGLPAGRIVALRGDDSSGATTLLHAIVAGLQRQERVPVYVDAGRSYDPETPARAGVDFDRLVIVRPEDPVHALAAATTLARSAAFDLIVFDRLEEAHGRLVPTWLGVMVSLLHGANTTMLVLCGPGERPGRFHGGRALAHYASVVLAARRVGWVRRSGGRIVGMRTRLALLEAKTGARPGEVELMSDE